jgi:DNA polymerase-4
MSEPHRVLLADCDHMFVSVARLVDPEGAGKARLLIVGGRRGERGVVLSASYEAREYGVRSGMPIAQAERLCPQATFAPVPRGECGLKSRQVGEVLEEWAPVVEQASIDEFYLGMDGTGALYRHEPLAQTAARIREDLLRRTGMAVSFGGGTNRLIAKLAVEYAKPKPGTDRTGVHVVPPGAEAAFVSRLELAAIPGIGPRFAENLRRKGLVRVTDALELDQATLVLWFGRRTGEWLYYRIRGVSHTPVRGGGEAKSVSHENTFATDLSTDDELERELVRLSAQVCRDLRSDALVTRTITVKLRDHDFRTRQASRTLSQYVSTERIILPVALELLRRLRSERRCPARLIGIGLSQLAAADRPQQLGLFGPTDGVESERDRRLAETVDSITSKFGRKAIGPARVVEDSRRRSKTVEDGND